VGRTGNSELFGKKLGKNPILNALLKILEKSLIKYYRSGFLPSFFPKSLQKGRRDNNIRDT
jgi:hypothetical protein